jgi:hypothetical protein
MFIGYYKSVASSKEFYSSKRSDLNFPIQVEYEGDRYLLNKTIQVSSELNMTLELTQEQTADLKSEIENFLFEISSQDRELYSRQEVENMLLDIYSLLKTN